jgi:hypothetical protein
MRAGLIEAFPAWHITAIGLLVGATGAAGSQSKCWMAGDFIPSVAAAAILLPQLPQKAVPTSNCVPHFLQNAIEIFFLVHGVRWFKVSSGY